MDSQDTYKKFMADLTDLISDHAEKLSPITVVNALIETSVSISVHCAPSMVNAQETLIQVLHDNFKQYSN